MMAAGGFQVRRRTRWMRIERGGFKYSGVRANVAWWVWCVWCGVHGVVRGGLIVGGALMRIV